MNSCWGQDTSYSKLLVSEAATVLAGVKIYSKDTLCPPFVYQTIETMDPKNRNLMLRLPLRMKLELRQEWVRDGQDRTLTRTAELFALYLNPSLLSGSLNGVGGMSGPLFFSQCGHIGNITFLCFSLLFVSLTGVMKMMKMGAWVQLVRDARAQDLTLTASIARSRVK